MNHIIVSERTEDAYFVTNKITAFNYAHTKVGTPNAPTLKDEKTRKTILLQDDSGEKLGGLVYLLRGSEEIYIAYFWLSEVVRGQGWGTKIIEFLKKETLRLKCKKITLYTTTHQAPGFYKKIGFRLIRQEPTPTYPQFTDFYFEWIVPENTDCSR